MKRDDIEHLLSGPLPTIDPEARQRLLTETQRRLHVNRRWKWVYRVTALAACYLAGLATYGLLRSTLEPRVIEVVRVERVPVEPSVPEAPEPPKSGYQLELLAEQADGSEAVALFRRAGDRYLLAEANYQAALRCYGYYLELAPESELLVSKDKDNWLLTALKNARQKEISLEDHDG